jgi:hypothetical protein
MADPAQSYNFTNFAGYAIPNTTQIPDEFLDYHMAFLSGAEVKVMLYIFRRTLGFKRYADNISLNQLLTGIVKRDGTRLDHGTGLSKSTLLNAIKSLVEKRLIIIEQRQSDERGNEPTTYRLNLSGTLGIKNDLGASENQTPLGIKNDLGVDRKLDQALVLKIEPTINSNTTNSETRDSNNNRAPRVPIPAVVVALLSEKGIGKGAAQALATAYPEDYIREKIAFLDFLLADRPGDVQKPAAWLRRAIENDYAAPDGYVSKEELERQEAEENRRIQAAEEAREREAERQRIRESEREERRQAARAKLKSKHNTPDDIEEEWQRVLEDIRITGQDSLYALVANSQVLNASNGVLDVAVSSSFHAQQLSHPGNIALLRRIIKQVTNQDYEPKFLLVEAIA